MTWYISSSQTFAGEFPRELTDKRTEPTILNCRSLYAKFEREVLREKVTLFRYVNTPDLFASPENNPNNECFCAPKAQLSDLFGGGDEGGNGTDHGDTPKTCMKNGAMLLTPCLGEKD